MECMRTEWCASACYTNEKSVADPWRFALDGIMDRIIQIVSVTNYVLLNSVFPVLCHFLGAPS